MDNQISINVLYRHKDVPQTRKQIPRFVFLGDLNNLIRLHKFIPKNYMGFTETFSCKDHRIRGDTTNYFFSGRTTKRGGVNPIKHFLSSKENMDEKLFI